jgi:hypothetical protein
MGKPLRDTEVLEHVAETCHRSWVTGEREGERSNRGGGTQGTGRDKKAQATESLQESKLLLSPKEPIPPPPHPHVVIPPTAWARPG